MDLENFVGRPNLFLNNEIFETSSKIRARQEISTKISWVLLTLNGVFFASQITGKWCEFYADNSSAMVLVCLLVLFVVVSSAKSTPSCFAMDIPEKMQGVSVKEGGTAQDMFLDTGTKLKEIEQVRE